MYMELAQAGLSLVQGLAAQSAAGSQNIINSAEAAAANTIREGRNIEGAATGSLARWMQSENNSRRLRAAGEARAGALQNLLRFQDAGITASIEDQLAAAEASGAYAANVALSGTGGNSIDVIDMTMRLRNSRAKAAKDRNAGYVQYDAIKQIAGIMPQAVEGLDESVIRDGQDYSTNIAKTQVAANPWLAALLSKGGQNAMSSVLGELTQATKPSLPTTGDFTRMDRQSFGYDTPVPSYNLR